MEVAVIDGAEPRLKTSIWVQAQIRLCDLNFIPAVIARRGDPDGGVVLVRLVRGRNENLLLRRQARLDGGADWVAVSGDAPLDDAEIDSRIAREVSRDRDLWVLEVDDPKRRYWPDRPIEA